MSDVEDAITILAQAHGIKELINAHQRARRAVTSAQRAERSHFGPLAQSLGVAMQVADEQKAAGASKAERLAGIAKTLQAAWPMTREWKYLCTRCDDYGLVITRCPGTQDATCGRIKAHLPHEFGTPCWCEKGRAFKEKPKPGPEDFTQAGKGKSMTRLGR